MENQQPNPSDLVDHMLEENVDTGDNMCESSSSYSKRSLKSIATRILWGQSHDAHDSVVEPQLRKYRDNRRQARLCALVAAGCFISASVFAGASVAPYLHDRATVAMRHNIAQSAARGINALWNYTPDDVDTLQSRATHFLTGDMAAEYRQYIGKIADLSKQAKISNSTQVVGVAVESVHSSDAVVIVYTNTETRTDNTEKNIPATRYMSYRVNMRRQGTQWLIASMPPITMLVINPRVPQAYAK